MAKGKDLKKQGVTIELDKERELVIDLNALCELEERFETIEKAMEVISTSPKMQDIRFFLWLALSHGDEELTEKDVGKLITMQNIWGIVDKLGLAMSESMPEVDEEEAKN